MIRKISVSMLALLCTLSSMECVGSFGLTRRLHGFVTSFSSKWIDWLVFLVFAILPVYGIAILADAVVVNSIEFWTGSGLAKAENEPETITQGDEKLQIERRGQEMTLRLYKNGELKTALVLKKSAPGRFFTLDGQEITVSTLETDGGHQIAVREGENIRGGFFMTHSRLAHINLHAQLLGSVAAR